MNIRLDIKPLSVNHAYRGRRFDTKEKRRYDRALQILMLCKKPMLGPYYRVSYRFFLKHFLATDQQNLLKCLTDNLVKAGIINDDRFIVDERIEKYPAKQDRIEICVENVDSSFLKDGQDRCFK